EDIARKYVSAASFDLKITARAAIDLQRARILVDSRSRPQCCLSQSCDITRRSQPRTGLINHATEINYGADLGRKVPAWHDPKLMIEFLRNDFRRTGIRVKMRLLARDFQVATAGKIAIDILFANNLFHQINRRE